MEVKPEPLPKHTIDALQTEFQYLRDVYSATRSEIRNDESKIINNINYTVASAGVMVTVSSIIAANGQYFLFLILPVIFFVLAFINFEHHLGISREGNYLRSIVYPRIREIIVLLDNGSHNFGVNSLDWEDFWVKNNIPWLLTTPISASLFGLHLIFSFFPILFFFYYRQSVTQPLSAMEGVLLCIDVIGFLTLIAYLIGFRIWSVRKRSK